VTTMTPVQMTTTTKSRGDDTDGDRIDCVLWENNEHDGGWWVVQTTTTLE